MPAWVECPSPATKKRKIQDNDLFQMYWQSILTITLTALTLLSCSSSKQDDPFIPEPDDNVGIAFGGNNGTWQDAPTTRATGTGLETLFPTFRVWGYKTTSTTAAAPSAPETVMNGYIVRHYGGTAGSTESNTTGWEYAGIQNAALSSIQTIKYWDYSATSYRFFAYSPSDTLAVSPQASDSKSFSFSFPFAYSDATTATTLPYISELWFALPASSGSVSTPASSYGSCVTLTFAPLIAKVRFKFSYPEGADAVVIKDIQFRDSRFMADPTTATTPLRGTITATYPLQGIPTSSSPTLSWTTTDTAEGSGASSTGPLILTIPYEEEGDRIHNVSDKSLYGKWYYVPPFNAIPYSQGAYTITANIDGRYASATVPEEFMQWKAGYQYTYIFKITEAGTVINFSDLQVEKWLTGSNIDNNGSGTEDW